jgi:hypothetical protein
MKTNSITLMTWFSTGEDFDIDWPAVHKILGADQVKWFTDQNHSDCLLVLKKNKTSISLSAEFYNPKILTSYYLMWA